MDSNLTSCFWGPEDGEAFLTRLKHVLHPYDGAGAYAGDNLIVFGRNLTFLADNDFMSAFNRNVHPSNQIAFGILWRLHVVAWAAKTCMRRTGDFIECGTSTGTSAIIVCDYLDFNEVSKTFYLYDTWGNDKRVPSAPYKLGEDAFRQTQARFSRYPNVRLVRGFLPESLRDTSPETIAFLHIDLNHADSEVAILDVLFERVVAGGIILFDDYGANGYRASCDAENRWVRLRGFEILELPTGQGLLIK